jgi:diguanylate cyclase (GGDEF)-like protein
VGEGVIQVLISENALVLFVDIKEQILNVSIAKGWIYIVFIVFLVCILANLTLRRVKDTERRLYTSHQKLRMASIELAVAGNKVDEYESKLHYEAYHDQLTGLKNRRSLIKNIEELEALKTKGKVALLILDIDNFKYINDTMGHHFGDLLLKKVSARLEEICEDDCRVYRPGGDEFIILLENYDESALVEKLALKILKECTLGYEIDCSKLFISISIGISLYPEHGESLDALFKNADIAVYKAKETGKKKIVFFNKAMNEAIAERVLLEKHLRTALDNDEFLLYYQPQLDIETNKVTGLEALIRWNNLDLGFVSPLRFISIAEDTHMIIPIGEWVIRNACKFLKKLHLQGHEELSMSVNVSMLQLIQDDFVDKLMMILEELELNPECLELEITESILMESYEAIAAKLGILRDVGIRIALDDFGKGYSSLNYLKQLPISTLKIDKSFVDTILAGDTDKSLTDLIIRIGRTMDLCVVAEGVETKEQFDFLSSHKCTKIQGYFFSKPIPEEAVMKSMKMRKAI